MAHDEESPPAASPSAPEPTQSIDAPPLASTSQSHDSAPPLTQTAPVATTPTPSLPPIEPRDYNNPTSSSLSSIRPVNLPPAYAPNSTVPTFIRILAILIFVVGGTSAATIAWVYKVRLSPQRNIFYPRLVLALKARTTLHQGHLKGYTQFVDAVRSFGKSGSRTMIGGLKDVPVVVDTVDSTQEASPQEETSSTQSTKEEKLPLTEQGDETQPLLSATEELPTPIPIEAPSILNPLLTSVQTLSSTLHTANLPPNPYAFTNASASSAFTTPNPNTTHQFTPPRSAAAASAAAAAQSRLSPDHTLVTSLGSLNEWVENQVYAIATQGYRTYGSVSGISSSSSGGAGGTNGGKEFKALSEATAGFKSEIRAVKGLLLNRRNFAVGTASR
ncbi:BZ3500_MvSof-1268-A1-R1_Chr2-1g04372 [Microbotryum saponariae]|uniref:BZ3500_MvSof-1268-A1-R1_Chr2-1g04372 protein n=1 Tax=Microbotryum saponariae TaxID=289078 RepID=A0A2X0KGA1_9BASI|nr:BZ3500_MvSof-1268-A1-R1_Chr2-1g04372 [Microbotryum saponariae]SCZ91577.1 BZ3501_MvSof-1269-A2-R1_Chr2-1g04028 [Microbotryum saponariae]